MPKFVHADSTEPQHQITPMWDQVLLHVQRSSPHEGRDVSGLLLDWITDMALSPSERREALVVHGPNESGKTALHNAIGTLVDRGEYLHGCDEHWLLDWGLQPGRRLAAYERGKHTPPHRKRRDNVLAQQVLTLNFQELQFVSTESWSPGSESHVNALWWYEAVLCDTPPTAALPRRTIRRKGLTVQTLELHFYLGRVEKPIPRLDLMRYLEDESAAFTNRLRRMRES